MGAKIALLLVLAGLGNALNRYGLPDVDGVGTLDTDTFKEFVNSRPATLVLFTSNEGIGTSEQWKQVAKLAEKVAKENLRLPVTYVDVDAEKEVAEEQKLASLPTIAFFAQNKRLIYQGKLNPESIYDWTVSNSRPKDERELKTIAEVGQVSKMGFAVLVKYPKGDNEQASAFAATAEAEPDSPFYYTHLDLSGIVFGAESKYSIVVFRTFDDGVKLMNGDKPFASEFIRQFLHMFKHPMIHPFDSEFVDKVYGGNVTGLVYFARNATRERTNTFNSFAFRNRHKIKIYKCEFADFSCLNLAYSVGYDDTEPLAVFILDNQGKGLNRYKMKAQFTEPDLTAFVDNYNNGLLTPFAKSEPEPVDNSGIIKKVVRNTVGKLVLDSPDTAVLVGYSDNPAWQEMEPILEEFAMKYGLGGKVRFFKWDASRNEHERVYLTTTPQILVYRKGNKGRPSVYLGKTKKAKIQAFLEEALEGEIPAPQTGESISTEL